jgi:hypothetical protein
MTDHALRMSPSRLADALACLGRVRLDPSDDALHIDPTPSPAAQTGLLVHRAFELCFSAPPLEPADAWAAAAATHPHEGDDRDEVGAGAFGDPVALALSFLRFERAVARVRSRLSPEDSVYPEEALQSSDGLLTGTADLVVRGRSHWIADLKTGAVRDRESGAPRPDYVRQVKLYAVMEFDQVGHWPTEGWLVSLHGQDVRFDLDPDECRSIATDARRVAERLVAGDDALTPSAQACRWCRKVARCPAPWSDSNTRQELRADRLLVTAVEQQLGEVWFEGRRLDEDDHPEWPPRFRRVSVADHAAAAELAVGCTAVVIGARWSDHAEAWHLSPSAGSRSCRCPGPRTAG